MRTKWKIPTYLLAAALTFTPALTWGQRSDQNDMHRAGHEAKDSAKDTGHAVKHDSKKAWKKTKHGTKKAWHKTKSTTKGAVEGAKEGAHQPQ